MTKANKFIVRILSGNSDQNIEFTDVIQLLVSLQFELRTKGSHHIFWKNGIDEIINLQPNGKKAKAYQIKQIRNILIKYKLIDHES
ncbi:MAG: type II toxin-antitoxin system HicA family toxin [Saprospiraceae bacterium]|nr:type II toxin-antitoxin system HicA family toxin [Saprospiraceae bacterium]MBK6479851.1 type II toxin-antitoxin system HicA family toxin [Saprospiraceae bacterium]MBK8777735.1 type II toxin-antitoxin system HicA family toxin [Saprospiraceae bacterium]MBP7803026.1 type II toxin-antitoxin system HicA family toxin [Saprospiraceae bacterium]MBP8942992.1 type II toxin-antitoxin system HicA family toxin [Saprospiraceae bacterium]